MKLKQQPNEARRRLHSRALVLILKAPTTVHLRYDVHY